MVDELEKEEERIEVEGPREVSSGSMRKLVPRRRWMLEWECDASKRGRVEGPCW